MAPLWLVGPSACCLCLLAPLLRLQSLMPLLMIYGAALQLYWTRCMLYPLSIVIILHSIHSSTISFIAFSSNSVLQ